MSQKLPLTFPSLKFSLTTRKRLVLGAILVVSVLHLHVNGLLRETVRSLELERSWGHHCFTFEEVQDKEIGVVI